MWSGADRRSRRPRSGRSIHRRDAMRNISVPRMLSGVAAAKQREYNTALFAVRRNRHREGLTAQPVGVVGGFALASARQFRIQVIQALFSCPGAERRAGVRIADVREQPLWNSRRLWNGCGLPLLPTLGKWEKMGSRPEACGFTTIFTEGGRHYLHIIWVMFSSGACGTEEHN